MGVAVYIKLEGFDHVPEVDGKSIGRNWDILSELARQSGFPPLEQFLSTNADDVADLIGDDVIQQPGVVIPPEQWFDASLGLAAVRRLRDACNGKKDIDNLERILHDLGSYEAVLTRADSAGIRFHFAFDF